MLRSATAGLVTVLGLFVAAGCTPEQQATLQQLGLDATAAVSGNGSNSLFTVSLPVERPIPTTTTTTLPPPPPPPPPTTAPAPPPPKPAAYPSDAALLRLRMCESTNNYRALSPGGTFRGAYQFHRVTWNGVAARHYPHLVGVDPAAASPADQDAMMRALYSERGRQPWPHCGRYI